MNTSTSRYLCVGYTPYSASTPSLAEPIFTLAGSDGFFVQEIDEVTNRVIGFRETSNEDDSFRLVTSSLQCSVGDLPLYCLLFEEKPPAIGRIPNLRPQFQTILSDDSSLVGLKIQIAEIMGSPSAVRRAKEGFDARISRSNIKSGMAYQRSFARTKLWKRLSAAAISEEARQHFVSVRGRIDVDVSVGGRLTIQVEALEPSDFPSLNFATLGQEIEDEIGSIDYSDYQNGLPESLKDEQDIEPDTIRRFLDRVVGPDGRITRSSYFRTDRLLQKLGFISIDQVYEAISKYDGLELGYIVFGNRQGQITRFELMLLAALGDYYIENNTWNTYFPYSGVLKHRLNKISSAGIPVGTFDIKADSERRRVDGSVTQNLARLPQLDLF